MSGQQNCKSLFGWADAGTVSAMGREVLRIDGNGNVGIGSVGTLKEVKPVYNITFHNGKEQMGVLEFGGSHITFQGKFDESAQQFIDHLATQWRKRLMREQADAVRVVADLVTFDLADEVEVDDAYRKGFTEAMQACKVMLLQKAKEMER